MFLQNWDTRNVNTIILYGLLISRSHRKDALLALCFVNNRKVDQPRWPLQREQHRISKRRMQANGGRRKQREVAVVLTATRIRTMSSANSWMPRSTNFNYSHIIQCTQLEIQQSYKHKVFMQFARATTRPMCATIFNRAKRQSTRQQQTQRVSSNLHAQPVVASIGWHT